MVIKCADFKPDEFFKSVPLQKRESWEKPG